jgi:hypothetical protein
MKKLSIFTRVVVGAAVAFFLFAGLSALARGRYSAAILAATILALIAFLVWIAVRSAAPDKAPEMSSGSSSWDQKHLDLAARTPSRGEKTVLVLRRITGVLLVIAALVRLLAVFAHR